MSLITKNAVILAAATCFISQAAENPANGSFEKGLSGYYINNRAAVKLETGKASHGNKNISVNPAGSKVINVVFNTAYIPNKIFVVKFDAAATQPKDGPKLKLALMLQGKTPITFYSGSNAEQKKALATPVALTSDWKNFTFKIGPVPAKSMGQDVKRLMFFLDTTPGTAAGCVRIDNIRITVEEPAKKAAPAAK